MPAYAAMPEGPILLKIMLA